MYQPRQKGARALFLDEEAQRVNDSPTLAVKFPQLKSLAADLRFTQTDTIASAHHIKYTLNLDVSKAAFRFSCPNNECVRGDFDLSDELTEAIAEHRTRVTGDMPCPGWLSKTTIDTVHCRHTLHYRLSLAY